jgi:hypothetical protein
MSNTAIELLSLAARRFIQYETRFYQALPHRRQGVAGYFGSLSQAISTLGNDLQRQKVPHESARELAKLASQLADFAGDVLGDQETERLRQFLEQACDTERVYREFNQSASQTFLVDELTKATIVLKALSQGLHLPSAGAGLIPPMGFNQPTL